MFRTLLLPLLLCLFCITGRVEAQPSSLAPARKKAVYGPDYYVSPSALDYTAAARAIVGDASTDYDRAERLYLWLCAHVTYDRSGQVRTADACWRRRTAVCQGYCELFYRLAETIGVRSKLVFGRCKHAGAYSKLEDHTWLSVDTEEGTILLDPTWGAGGYVRGEFVRLRNPLLWFDVAPEWFIFTHQPKSHRRQCLDVDVSDEQFAALPYVTPMTALLGIEGKDALTRMLAGGDALPIVMAHHSELLERLTIVDIPTTRHLVVDSTYTFVVDNPEADYMLTIVNEGETINQNLWSCVEPPAAEATLALADTLQSAVSVPVPPASRSTLYSVAVTPHHRGRLTLALMPRVGVPILRHLVEYVVE